MGPSIELLARNSLFASFSPAERKTLAERALRRDYRKGEAIASHGDVWPNLLLVETGSVNLVRESTEGRTLIVTALGSGEIFWGLALFYPGAPSIVTVQAREESRLWLWHRDILLPYLQASGQASWELCLLLVRRMQRASEILSELAFQPVTARVARLLVDHFKEADGDRVKRDLTLDEMAARAATTREMVCRALYDFADKGVIRITRTEFQINDRHALIELADQL